MSIEIPLSKRLLTAGTWPAGVMWTSCAYIWRTTPLHRRQLDGSLPEDLPPPLPDGVELDDVQRPQDGVGPLLRRIYTGVIADTPWTAASLMERVSADPDQVAPRALAKFSKTEGAAGAMNVGDEFLVQMPGPWNGPVRAIHVDARSFRFATLSGHLEAGQIEWRAGDVEAAEARPVVGGARDSRPADDSSPSAPGATGMLRFQIESWARAGDWFSAIAHHRLLMAKEVQLHMWTSVVERVARFACGRLVRGVDIETRRVDGQAFERRG